MQTPSGQEVRGWTPQTKWATIGYGAGTLPDTLDFETKLAVQYIEWVIGRALDASMPNQLEAMAQKAVALRVVQQVYLDDEDTVEGLGSGASVKNISVTGFSENYIVPGDASQSERKGLMVNPHPELNRLLWALMTPERMRWWRGWLADGVIPQYGVVEMDWSGANRWGGLAEVGGGGMPGDIPGYRGSSAIGGNGPLTGSLSPSVVLGSDWGWE